MTDQMPDDLIYHHEGDAPDDLVYEAPPEKTPDTSASRWVGVANRALAPYITAAGAGAAAGSVIPGVGTVAGGIAGPIALGATDLANYLYNTATGSRNKGLSERIQDLAVEYGLGQEPETAGQRIFSTGLEAGTGASSFARGAGQLASQLPKLSTAERVATELSRTPTKQAIAGFGAGAFPAAGEETGLTPMLERYGVPSSATGLGLSLVGGLGTGSVATSTENLLNRGRSAAAQQLEDAARTAVEDKSRTASVLTKLSEKIKPEEGSTAPTAADLRQQADTLYQRVDKAGVKLQPKSFNQFLDDLPETLESEGYNPDAHKAVETRINMLEKYRDKGMSLTDLDKLRSKMQTQIGSIQDADTRRVMRDLVGSMDDFVANTAEFEVPYAQRHAPLAATSEQYKGNLRQANEDLLQARKVWQQMSKTQRMENIVEKAKLSGQPVNESIRSQVRSMLDPFKPNRLRGYSPEERAMLRNLVVGDSDQIMSDIGGGMLKVGAPLSLVSSLHPTIGPTLGVPSTMASIAAGSALKRAAAAQAERQLGKIGEYVRGARPKSYTFGQAVTPAISALAPSAASRTEDGTLIIPITGDSSSLPPDLMYEGNE
jgi:hypothetical protein